MTAKTPAERQADRRARVQATLTDQSAALARLVEEAAALRAEVAALRAENDGLKAKLHQQEVAALKAKLKAAKSA